MSFLDQWENYLSTDDLNTIKEFLTKTQNGEKLPYYLLFYGTGGNGKSTLVNEIISYLGEENCKRVLSGRDVIVAYDGPTKLLVFGDHVNMIQLPGLIKTVLSNDFTYVHSLYKKDFSQTKKLNANSIVVTNDISFLENNDGLKRRTKIIKFTHKF